ARILLGLIFTFFGLNAIHPFLPNQLPPGDAGIMIGLMFKYGWVTFLGVLYVISGVLLLAGRYVGVALTILGPIIVVILLYHITMDPKNIGPGVVVALLEVFLIYAYWHHFDGVCRVGKPTVA